MGAGGAAGEGGQGGAGAEGGAPACGSDGDCDNGFFCDGAETCVAGECQSGEPPSCDDAVACTVDYCNLLSDSCAHAADATACDDGLFCNGLEACDPELGDPVTGCLASSDPPCDDGVSCTLDACDEPSQTCSHVPDDAACDDGSTCNGAETCDPAVGCVPAGAAPSCDDGVPCTADFCDLELDACAHVAQDYPCDDGLFCNGLETCDPDAGDPATGCAPGTQVACHDGLACTADACDETTDGCTHVPNDVFCDDGLFCNGKEICWPAGGCAPGPPPACDDGVICTSDACSEAQKSCVHVPNHEACDDGLFCNGAETRAPESGGPAGCKPGVPMACPSDGIACTADACDEMTLACASVPDSGQCAGGQFCLPAKGGCIAGEACSKAADCDDGDPCNGVETCDGVCQPGEPPSCDDGVACTVDACDPVTGACVHAPEHALCDDGFACTGVETCDPALDCVKGPPPDCDDGVACTADGCVEPNGTCSHLPQDNLCDDGKLCNGQEVCTPGGCAPGPAYTCPDDGLACTTQVCDPVLNACKAIPDHGKCPCGQTCNPAAGGCGKLCKVATCQGKVYACGDCIDNDGDCAIDSADDQCLGPCDNTEAGFHGGIPGQNNAPCKADCYFDQDTGAGNDDCFWSHACDPLAVAPDDPPEGSACKYDPKTSIPGYGGTCSQAFASQSAECASYCGPLVPNGCDCFGCCAIPGAPTTVYLGSKVGGAGSCTIDVVADPNKCKPCTQVASCLNACETCELCVGKTTLPPECAEQICPAGAQKCGLPWQPPCPFGYSCITGCCEPNPE